MSEECENEMHIFKSVYNRIETTEANEKTVTILIMVTDINQDTLYKKYHAESSLHKSVPLFPTI